MCRLAAFALAIAISFYGSNGSAQGVPRMADGRPDLRGIWQALNTANWNIEDHSAELGVPAGQGVVEGNELPYLADALAQRRENYEKRLTLVVDVIHFTDQTWFDRSGNFHSEELHVVERYTLTGSDHMLYEATIEDPKVFSRPWSMSMPLYRRQEDNMQIIEYECGAYLEEARDAE